MCGQQQFVRLCFFESRRVTEGGKETSSKENVLGLREKCIGGRYDTFLIRNKRESSTRRACLV